jgi:FAD:protein FMN transferase
MLKRFLVLGILLFISACDSPEASEGPLLTRYDMTFDEYLNTVSVISIFHEPGFDGPAFQAEVEAFLDEADQIYSAYSPGAEMYEVNLRADQGPTPISEELMIAIRESLYYAELSDGLFDPTILPLVELWGIDGSSWFEGGVIPPQSEIDAALALIDYTQVVLDEANQTVEYLIEGMRFDLGGYSKGFIAYELREMILDAGINHAMINIGSSSQLTIGNRAIAVDEEKTQFQGTNQAWQIGTKDPFDPFGINPSPIGSFGLLNKALSSSGSSQQYFEQEGRRYHHLYDPFTGYPVENNLIVVQVISEDPIGVDPLSTLIYLMGLEAGYEFVENLEGVEAIFITYDRRIFKTSGFGNYDLWDDNYRIGAL